MPALASSSEPDPDPEPFLLASRDSEFWRFDLQPDFTLCKTQIDRVADKWVHLLSPIPLSASPSELPQQLRYITVINSCLSGTGQSSQYYFNLILPLFKEFGIHHVCVKTVSSDCVANHARSFTTSGTVLLLGGDTTVSEFVNALAPTADGLQMRIAIVPTGTGNALANSTGHNAGNQTPASAVQALFCAGHEFQPLSVFPVRLPSHQPRCAVVVFSFGLHAGLVADSDVPEMRKLGSKRFAMAAEALIARDPVYRAVIPQAQSQLHSYYLVTPMRYLDTNFLISPRGEPPSSSKLFLVYLAKMQGSRFMEIMQGAYNAGAHVDMPDVTYQEIPAGTHFDICNQPELERRCCVDGATLVAPAGRVEIGPATHTWNGWQLFVWR